MLDRAILSGTYCNYWIPAFAGMTRQREFGLFTSASFLITDRFFYQVSMPSFPSLYRKERKVSPNRRAASFLCPFE